MESPPLPTAVSPTVNVPSMESPSRPPLTADSTSSHFADSGLGTLGLRTPSPKCKDSLQITPHFSIASPSKTTNCISSRLEQLAALAWEAEEDDRLDEHTRAAVQSQLHAIEAQLEGRTRGNDQTTSDVDLSNTASNVSSGASSLRSPSTFSGPVELPPTKEELAMPDLNPVLSHLTMTLKSMRARLSESKHLHNLAMSKLSSVAQENVNLTSQLISIRKTNTSLSHANAALRMRVDDLEATTTQQAVAVSAMTGAVAGLESYVTSSTPSTPRDAHARIHANGQTHTPNTGARHQTVVRGSGRFRGKYPIPSPQTHAHQQRGDSTDINMNLDGPAGDHNLPPAGDAYARQTELQEGILAWVRGFRDVEAGWREMNMDVHRTPTRFGGHGDFTAGVQSTTPMTPTRRGPEPEAERAQSRSDEVESVLLQGDKDGGSDVFGR